jgi:tetratricopeptide (TPR) repeat protein
MTTNVDITPSRARLRRLVLALAVLAALIVVLFVGGRLSLPGPTGDAVSALAPARPSGSAIPSPRGSGAARPAGERSTTQAKIEEAYAAVQRDPEDLGAYLTLGFAYLQNARERGDPTDYGRAELAFQEVLRRDPNSRSALAGKGALLLARHEFAEALAVGSRLTELAPKDPVGWGVMGDAQTELGRYDDAIKSVQRMVDLRPDLASYSRVSYQRELHGQLDPAIKAMEMAFRAGSTNVENHEYIRVLVGNLYFAKGDLATAEKTYDASLARAPDFTWALAGLARVRAAQGDLNEGISLYQRAVDRIPLPEFVIALGEMQEAAGRHDDARRSFEVARAIASLFASNGVQTDLDLALFEANHGDPGKALEQARAAYERQPNIKAADALAWALYKAGRLDEARERAEEALRLGTRDGVFLYHAGMIAKAQGDEPAAKSYLQKAFELNPFFSPLYEREARAALTELGE